MIFIGQLALTHWGPNEVDAIFQMIFSNAFSWMKMCKFQLRFHWILSNQQYSITGSDNGLAPTRRQAIIWTNDGKLTDAYMRHLASMS